MDNIENILSKIREKENQILRTIENEVKTNRDTTIALMIAQARGSSASKYGTFDIQNPIHQYNQEIKNLWKQIEQIYENNNIGGKKAKKSKKRKTKKARKTRKK